MIIAPIEKKKIVKRYYQYFNTKTVAAHTKYSRKTVRRVVKNDARYCKHIMNNIRKAFGQRPLYL